MHIVDGAFQIVDCFFYILGCIMDAAFSERISGRSVPNLDKDLGFQYIFY